MFDTYNVPNEIDVNVRGDVLIRDQKHEWKEHYCRKCKDGIITEKEFDSGKAIEYLESIGELDAPPGVPMQAVLRTAPFRAMGRGDNISFWNEKSYPCVHKYCKNSEPISNI